MDRDTRSRVIAELHARVLGENTPEYKARLERRIERNMKSGKRTPFKKSAAGQALDAQREVSRKRREGTAYQWPRETKR
ncbi:MAG: hypothetical protein F4X39_00270 [Acidobacteriia bacterium]|nr:hypothetical protein [Terriglobia bacterium]